MESSRAHCSPFHKTRGFWMCKVKNWITRIFLVTIAVFLLFLSAMGVKAIFGEQVIDVTAQAVPSCLNRTNIPDADLHWIYVPENAAALHTEEDYFYLAGQLISNNVVDASTCPSGGLTLNGYANACGMSVAHPKVLELQNILDESILNANGRTASAAACGCAARAPGGRNPGRSR